MAAAQHTSCKSVSVVLLHIIKTFSGVFKYLKGI